ncbi:hypothetical protein [Citricoccus nitrophenolicus]|uniref:hypothetical protein n=1 Tax=Citricoccus nitrophenolicus TaxID=863575 RepID=UPI0031E643D3
MSTATISTATINPTLRILVPGITEGMLAAVRGDAEIAALLDTDILGLSHSEIADRSKQRLAWAMTLQEKADEHKRGSEQRNELMDIREQLIADTFAEIERFEQSHG